MSIRSRIGVVVAAISAVYLAFAEYGTFEVNDRGYALPADMSPQNAMKILEMDVFSTKSDASVSIKRTRIETVNKTNYDVSYSIVTNVVRTPLVTTNYVTSTGYTYSPVEPSADGHWREWASEEGNIWWYKPYPLATEPTKLYLQLKDGRTCEKTIIRGHEYYTENRMVFHFQDPETYEVTDTITGQLSYVESPIVVQDIYTSNSGVVYTNAAPSSLTHSREWASDEGILWWMTSPYVDHPIRVYLELTNGVQYVVICNTSTTHLKPAFRIQNSDDETEVKSFTFDTLYSPHIATTNVVTVATTNGFTTAVSGIVTNETEVATGTCTSGHVTIQPSAGLFMIPGDKLTITDNGTDNAASAAIVTYEK